MRVGCLLLLALASATHGFQHIFRAGSANVRRAHLGEHDHVAEPASVRSTEQLHAIANRAVKRGKFEEACECYSLAARHELSKGEKQGVGRAFLLLALTQQRLGEIELARQAFSTGIALHRTDARLMQAWGLFESKHGSMSRALRLLRRAVALDPSLSSVLRWKIFRTHGQQLGHDLSHAHSARHRPVTSSISAPEGLRPPEGSAAEAEATMAGSAAEAEATMAVPRPPVRYTVTSQNVGWRGREEEGEDPALWYDADGVRNGPPANYWRQAMDERAHRADMDVVDALLSASPLAADAVVAREAKRTMQSPQLNRKMLGRWAPVVLRGEPVATAGAGGDLTVPLVLEVRRDGPPVQFTDRHGTHDAHLEEGEALQIAISSGGAVSSRAARAGEGGEGEELCTVAPVAGGEGGGEGEGRRLPLTLGRVTFLSDYLLLQRAGDGDGGAVDAWVRAPPAGAP